jgi:CHAT domain-containing protein
MLLHLATAEAELGNYTAARSALDEANSLFASLGAETWKMVTRLKLGQIALKQDNFCSAYQDALAAVTYFKSERQLANFATASLLIGHTSLISEDFASAAASGAHALQISRRFNVPSLRYAAHLLLGQVAEAQSLTTRAIRHYQAATATVERVQRRLTITLRPGFLENKGEAWKKLIGLYLRKGKVKNAFEALEQAKSGVLLSYLANRERLHWAQNDPESQELIDELNRLRAEHQWYYRLAHDPPRDPEIPSTIQPEQALDEITKRERRMRAITEHLYLRSSLGSAINPASVASLPEIQDALTSETKLVEFYNDGIYFWAFILDGNKFNVQRLPITTEMLNHLLAQLNLNLAAALKVNVHSSSAYKLTKLAQHILCRINSLLIQPIAHQLVDSKQLMIVPYGALHYLPFHLLYDGSTYLVESFETVIMPAASLVTRPGLKRPQGALILAHSWENRIPHTQTEAQIVKQLFGGKLYSENSASRLVLQTPPSQILHIAAHGQHRLDQPDLSYLELADGQLFADDLLQEDLSYELVTLSACETGRGKIVADEELIGIGRGLLYAGAGALILSLWRVADFSTIGLMERLYSALKSGKSKAAALRLAQLSLLAQDRNFHPAFWGAFQLSGDHRPLSTTY